MTNRTPSLSGPMPRVVPFHNTKCDNVGRTQAIIEPIVRIVIFQIVQANQHARFFIEFTLYVRVSTRDWALVATMTRSCWSGDRMRRMHKWGSHVVNLESNLTIGLLQMPPGVQRDILYTAASAPSMSQKTQERTLYSGKYFSKSKQLNKHKFMWAQHGNSVFLQGYYHDSSSNITIVGLDILNLVRDPVFLARAARP